MNIGATTLTIENSVGMKVSLVDVGASIQFIYLPFESVSGKSVSLGFKDPNEYWHNPASLGVTVGRFSNRIANAQFSLEGNTYHLSANEGPHQLHGGINNFGHRRWKVLEQCVNKAVFGLQSEDGDQGFPGNLDVVVTYIVNDDNSLSIDYQATTDKVTVVNLTDHSYFNLDGIDSTDLSVASLNHSYSLWLNASQVTEVNDACIPTGNIVNVHGTWLDFTEPKSLMDLEGDEGIIHLDNNFVLNSRECWTTEPVAIVHSPVSRVCLEVFTTKPGLQVYAAQHLDTPFQPNAGLCLETQFFPDSPNQPNFPSSVLKPNDKYHHETIYRFSVV